MTCAAAHARQSDIVFIAPTNHAMPFAQFHEGQLSGGILKDLGEAIAHRMGRNARFVSIPSKRVGLVLSQGEADVVCYVLPGWIEGDFIWSQPFIPNSGAIVALADAPPINTLKDLSGQRVGTVLGYRYPHLEAALGDRFTRNDAPSMQSTLSKMDARRMQYAVIEQMTIAYHLRGLKNPPMRIALVFDTFKAQCAFSRHPKTPAADAERAIGALVAAGAIDSILAQYR